jgi:predicted O-methyltransferase YrrM
MKDDYQFTQDWFSWSPPVWDQVFKQLNVKKILEIGCFEGRATTWLIENVKWQKDPRIICIDTFEGGEEHTPEVMAGVKDRFTHNIWVALQKTKLDIDIEVLEVLSHKALKQIKTMFEFIYIDGSHVAKDVLTDACMAWPMLSVGGVMCFDDYGWGEPIPETHKPKLAIDAFITIFQEDLEVIHRGYQLIVQKVK